MKATRTRSGTYRVELTYTEAEILYGHGTKYMYLGTALKMPSAKAGIVIWVDNKFEVIHDLTAPELDWPPSLIGRRA